MPNLRDDHCDVLSSSIAITCRAGMLYPHFRSRQLFRTFAPNSDPGFEALSKRKGVEREIWDFPKKRGGFSRSNSAAKQQILPWFLVVLGDVAPCSPEFSSNCPVVCFVDTSLSTPEHSVGSFFGWLAHSNDNWTCCQLPMVKIGIFISVFFCVRKSTVKNSLFFLVKVSPKQELVQTTERWRFFHGAGHGWTWLSQRPFPATDGTCFYRFFRLKIYFEGEILQIQSQLLQLGPSIPHSFDGRSIVLWGWCDGSNDPHLSCPQFCIRKSFCFQTVCKWV